MDLFVANYVDYYLGTVCRDGSGRRDYCVPTYFAPTVAKLFHNRGVPASGAGVTFNEVMVYAGISTLQGRGLGFACRDFSENGRVGIYVANDKQVNRLCFQWETGLFRDETLFRGVAVNQLGERRGRHGNGLR